VGKGKKTLVEGFNLDKFKKIILEPPSNMTSCFEFDEIFQKWADSLLFRALKAAPSQKPPVTGQEGQEVEEGPQVAKGKDYEALKVLLGSENIVLI
jgi:hypothetical protein